MVSNLCLDAHGWTVVGSQKCSQLMTGTGALHGGLLKKELRDTAGNLF